MTKIAVFQKTHPYRSYTFFQGLFDNFDLGHFGYNISYCFEDYSSILENVEDDIFVKIENWYDSLFDIANVSDEEKRNFNEITKNTEYNYDDLGDIILLIDGNPTIWDTTFKEYTAESGSVDIDGDYDTWYWCPVNELEEKYINIILEDGSSDTYEWLVYTHNKDMHDFLSKLGFDNNTIAEALYFKYTIEELIKMRWIVVLEDDCEESDGVEWDDVFYRKY